LRVAGLFTESSREPLVMMDGCFRFLIRVGLLSALGTAAASGLRGDDSGQRTSPPAAVDRLGDPLPARALARFGSARLRHGERIESLVFSPDGKILASAGGDRVCLWDRLTGKELHSLRHEFACRVAFSADGAAAASGSAIGLIKLWEFATGKEVRAFGGGASGRVHAVAFAPDGKRLAVGTEDGAVRFWDTSRGAEVGKLDGACTHVLAFSPDGKWLAAGDSGIEIWDAEAAKRRCLLRPPGKVLALAFSAGGERIASADDGGVIQLWDLATEKEVHQFRTLSQSIEQVGRGLPTAFDRHARTVAVGGRFQGIRVSEVATGKEVAPVRIRPWNAEALALSPDGKVLAWSAAGVIHLYDCERREPIEVPPEGSDPIVGVAFGSSGRWVSAAGAYGTLCRRELWTGKRLSYLHRPDHPEETLALSPDGQRVLTREFLQPRMRVRDTADGSETAAPEGDFLKILRSGGFAAARTSRPVPLGAGDDAGRNGVGFALAPDGKTWAVLGGPLTHFSDAGDAFTAEEGVLLLDAATGKPIGPCARGRRGTALAFSSDSRTLAVGDAHGLISLWEMATQKEIRQFQGHAGEAYALTFSSDGTLLASGGRDQLVRIWEVYSGHEVARFAGHRGAVTAIAFSADGRTLLSGGQDTTLLLWDLTGRLADGKLRPGLRPGEPLEALWHRLAGQGPDAFHAAWSLVANPSQGGPFVAERVQWLTRVDSQRIARRIAELDDDDFAVRERATVDLEACLRWAEPALRKALANPPSVEAGRRIERILEKLKGGTPWAQERVRVLRAIGVLERIATPVARESLRGVAAQAPEAEFRQAAKAALARLAERSAPADPVPTR
jgi:WD40 repeat protein